MNALREAKCLIHPGREAAARCPACGHFFCRECVTEHDSRVICAKCLAAEVQASAGRRRAAGVWRLALPAAAGVLVLWVLFYALGRTLASMPARVHDGGLLEALNE